MWPPLYYVLDADGTPVAEPNIMKWADWMGSNDRHVAQDYIEGVRVSTVFLGLDHSFMQGPPVLWETMIFGGPHHEYQDRYCTREAALLGHATALALVSEKSGSDAPRCHGA